MFITSVSVQYTSAFNSSQTRIFSNFNIPLTDKNHSKAGATIAVSKTNENLIRLQNKYRKFGQNLCTYTNRSNVNFTNHFYSSKSFVTSFSILCGIRINMILSFSISIRFNDCNHLSISSGQ